VFTICVEPDEEGKEVRLAVRNIPLQVDELIREVVLTAQGALWFAEELRPNLPSIPAERFAVIGHCVGMERGFDQVQLMTIHAAAVPQQRLVDRRKIAASLVTGRYQDYDDAMTIVALSTAVRAWRVIDRASLHVAPTSCASSEPPQARACSTPATEDTYAPGRSATTFRLIPRGANGPAPPHQLEFRQQLIGH
jgi:hypothetical protein